MSAVPALATGPDTFDPVFWIADADVTFSATSVTVPAGGSATVDATIAALALPAGLYGLYGGYLVFTPADVERALRVPFAGFMGDYQAVPALGPTQYGFPWLARIVGGYYVEQADGAVFDLSARDFPVILVHLEHQARIVQVEVYDAVTGRAWHRFFREEYVSRNATEDEFEAIRWMGKTWFGSKNDPKVVTVPPGKYVLRLSVLKALGDETNPAHWETWTSPWFSIER